MREFDFDELDRAVHSVLGSAATTPPEVPPIFTPAPSPSSVATQKPTEEATFDASDSEDRRISSHAIHARVMPPRRSVAERPSLRRHQDSPLDRATQNADTAALKDEDRVTTNLPSRSTPAIASASAGPQPQPRPLSRRRSGKVMDIVLPADSTVASPKDTLKNTPQHEKPQKPVSSFDFAPVTAPEVTASKVVESPKIVRPPRQDPTTKGDYDEEQLPASSQENAIKSFESPEKPAEQVRPTAAEKPNLPERSKKEAKPFEEPIVAADTPFISAAQVEKRPLGGGLRMAEPEVVAVEEVPKGEPEVDVMQEKIRQIESMDFSEELESENQQAEVTSTNKSSTTQSAEPTSLADAPMKPTSFAAEQASLQNTSVVIPPQGGAAPTATGPTSITRQYKAEARIASVEDTSPIFDPESYHQPLAHEPKRKSGWGVVIAVVALLLVGAVAAAVLWWSGILPVPM